jgi:hypothetical protein
VDGPFFIGADYTETGAEPYPSIMFGTTVAPDLCHIFQYYCDVWYGWYAFWPTPPSYPFFWVEGETEALACCPDLDSDGICESEDNCPTLSNPDQADTDNDGLGDLCDNCPNDFNPGQEDTDGDGFADACDNCPSDYNSSQLDADADGIGDVCDLCPLDAQNDTDGDGVCGNVDNCPTIANADQADGDSDGTGDVCELIESCVGLRGNINGFIDDLTDISDLVYLVQYMFQGGPPPAVPEEADVNGDGSLDITDLVYLVDWMFTGGPAPAPCP